MELNFTEMNNAQNPYENYDNNSYQNENIDSQKYWEPNATQNKNLQPKKRRLHLRIS